MELLVRDTLSGKRRPVRPRPGRPLALYVCGPTVYDAAHVGHARNYLVFDVVRRFLEAEGTPVRYVMNVTDFEDKLEARARQLGITWRALARREERRFFRDLDALGVKPPTLRPRASDFIPQMIRVARALERTGRVHRSGNEWIYTPPPRPAGQNFPTDRQLADHAVPEPGHPFPSGPSGAGEFMIWRLQDPPQPSWPSPWGRGGPGWHLECYAMASQYLGLPVDLHGGGLDLVYPHHYAENEVALALKRRPFSRVYLHDAFVLLKGSKMSKSVGNLVPLRTALDAVGAGALRWYLLATHFDRRIEWDDGNLARAAEEFAATRSVLRRWSRGARDGTDTAAPAERVRDGVRRDLARNLGTDRAIVRLRRWARTLEARPDRAVSPRYRLRARRALEGIVERTGLPLL